MQFGAFWKHVASGPFGRARATDAIRLDAAARGADKAARAVLGAALLCCASLTTAASAEPPSPSVIACMTPAPEIASVVAALQAEGWAEVAERPLDETLVEALIWPYAMTYLGNDTGGESTAHILELQRGTVRGIARKADIPQSKTRIMTRQPEGQLEAVAINWRTPQPGFVEINCRFAWSGATRPAGDGVGFERHPLVRRPDETGGRVHAFAETTVFSPGVLSLSGTDPGHISAATVTNLLAKFEK